MTKLNFSDESVYLSDSHGNNSYSSRLGSLVCLFIYLLVGVLFIFKQVSRLDWYVASTVSLGYVVLILALPFLTKTFARQSLIKSAYIILVAYTLLMGIIVPLFIPPGTSGLDRWDIIDAFDSALLAGDYPYLAKGHVNYYYPGPSPFYFILTLPFYLTGWYVGIPLAGAWIYVWALKKFNDGRSRPMSILLLILAPFLFYEIVTCSTIFFNSAVILLWLCWLKPADTTCRKRMLLHGFIGGLLLATRNCYIIPVIVTGCCLIRQKDSFRNVLLWGAMVVVGFILIFLPFVFGWGYQTWLEMNPFKLHFTVFLPQWVTLLIISVAVISGLLCRHLKDTILLSGIILFVSALLQAGMWIGSYSLEDIYLNSMFDITYLIICMPFVMPYITLGGRSGRPSRQLEI